MKPRDKIYQILFERWDRIQIDEEQLNEQFDIQIREDHTVEIWHNHKLHRAEILETSGDGKQFKIRIDQMIFRLYVQDELDRLIEQLDFSHSGHSKLTTIKAPIPGLILDISVKEGEEVDENQKLCIIEAMKMQNVIQSPVTSTVKQILVKPGEKVEKNQLLIELE